VEQNYKNYLKKVEQNYKNYLKKVEQNQIKNMTLMSLFLHFLERKHFGIYDAYFYIIYASH
jgi:hypothetical protein